MRRAWVHEQRLIHPFGTSRGIDSMIPTTILELEDGALGEGSPVRYLGQKAPDIAAAALALYDSIPKTMPTQDAIEFVRCAKAVPSAARAAVDVALHDRWGRAIGRPLREVFRDTSDRRDGRDNAVTSLTIGLDSLEVMERKAAEAAHYPILKVKLGRGLAEDRERLRLVRAAAPNARLTIDANAGWDVETTRAMLPILADAGAEVLEQPLAIGRFEELRPLLAESPIQIVADEDAQDLGSLARLEGCVDGINVKLMKCGGIAEARLMISHARERGWKLLLGCMVETGIGIAAAGQLAHLADWLDLDGALLSSNDPSRPIGGRPAGSMPWDVHVPDAPGLGAELLRFEGT